MKITLGRFFVFIALVAMIALGLQQCWQSKSDAEKWLYLLEEPAREYAGRVLGPDRGTGLQPPEAFSEMQVEVNAPQGYVVFSSAMFSATGEYDLHLAFSPQGPPPNPADKPALGWVPVRDAWYRLRPVP